MIYLDFTRDQYKLYCGFSGRRGYIDRTQDYLVTYNLDGSLEVEGVFFKQEWDTPYLPFYVFNSLEQLRSVFPFGEYVIKKEGWFWNRKEVFIPNGWMTRHGQRVHWRSSKWQVEGREGNGETN